MKKWAERRHHPLYSHVVSEWGIKGQAKLQENAVRFWDAQGEGNWADAG